MAVDGKRSTGKALAWPTAPSKASEIEVAVAKSHCRIGISFIVFEAKRCGEQTAMAWPRLLLQPDR
jgi:hypothetical protein